MDPRSSILLAARLKAIGTELVELSQLVREVDEVRGEFVEEVGRELQEIAREMVRRALKEILRMESRGVRA